MDWQHLLPYLGPVLIVALVARRLIRNAPQKVKPSRLFIAPAIIVLAVAVTFAMTPLPGPLWIAGFALALAAGGIAGYLMTHHQEFSIDYETGEITSRATPIGLILVGGLFAVRFGLKYVTNGGNPYGPPNLHPSATAIGWTDMGIMFALGLVLARAATTWLRTRPLIAAHKGKQDGSAPADTPP